MKRLECLDGLRGFLAIYVLLGHMAPFAVLPAWLQSILSHGGAAVDLFFTLSGLVITQSLLHAGGRAKPFLIARAARIFPVFLVVFALAIVVDPWSCGFDRMPWIGPDNPARTICVMASPHAWLTEVIAHLTMIHGLFPNGILKDVWVSFLGSAWSLSTEWQFYALALLVVAGFQNFRATRPAGCLDTRREPASLRQAVPPSVPDLVVPSRALCWTLLGLAVAGVAWRFAVPEIWQFSRAFLPNKAHFFALGVASVAVVRQDSGARLRYGLVLAATLAICGTQEMTGKMLPPLVWTVCLLVQLRPEYPGLRLAGRVLRSRMAQYLGAISYCLYLINEPVHKMAAAALSWAADSSVTLFTVLWLPAAFGLPILASVWLHTYIEAPALKWGRSAAMGWAPKRDTPTVQVHSRGL